VAAGEGSGEQERAERETHNCQRDQPGPAFEPLTVAALEQRDNDDADDQKQEEPAALEKRIVGALEVDLDIARGECADRQTRQERSDPDRRRDAHALEYVERQMHRAVPCLYVTIDKRA
jgi:hypothetical protein